MGGDPGSGWKDDAYAVPEGFAEFAAQAALNAVAPVVPTEEETIIAVMTVVKKSQIRAGFEMGSEKAGVAAKGPLDTSHPQA